ncbi:hypothetical protein ACT3S9_03765 [Pseudoalteromonas sp. AOP31-A2-14]|uniref:hypothetical protein n=1 Tax=Pseudoalteromonas sp. AOP31-A2-14 TaxID=3457695 RepID=UPI00403729CB
MKFLSYVFLCFSIFNCAASMALEAKYHEHISTLVTTFKNNDKAAIASLIDYPLHRQYPVPEISNENDLINRFDEVFDNELIAVIANSNVNADWSKVGWRGIMLNQGVVWVDTKGKITGINHQTNKSKALASDIIARDQHALHSSVSRYKKPILDWQTAKYHIRVDDLGDYNYRYVAWSIDKKPSDKPDIILTNGDIIFEGSGGNHHYLFKNGRFRYVLHVTVIGCDSSPLGWLEVYKDDDLLMSEPVISTW